MNTLAEARPACQTTDMRDYFQNGVVRYSGRRVRRCVLARAGGVLRVLDSVKCGSFRRSGGKVLNVVHRYQHSRRSIHRNEPDVVGNSY